MAANAPVPPTTVRLAVLDIKFNEDDEARSAGYLSEMVRGAARRALPSRDFVIMTRDNIIELLPPGRSLQECVSECAVSVGRNIGADIVMAGELYVQPDECRLALSLYRTDDGNLIGSDFVVGRDRSDMESKLGRVTEQLLQSAVAGAQSGITARIGNQGETWRHNLEDLKIVEFLTTPPGATVLVDETPFCSPTPCRGELAVGAHKVEIMLADYHRGKPISS